jgi:predicted Rossmann fold nucleotide-binding protein DprA/Smf involved in DNA uptake
VKLLIVGSRSITKFDFSPYVFGEVDTIISGGAEGIDMLAEQYADAHRLSKYIIRPRYDLYGRAAPIKRNEKIVDMADAVLIIWDGFSKGTQYTLNYAKKNEQANYACSNKGNFIR